MAKPTKVDLVGVGLNATDTVIPLSTYTTRGSKVEYSTSTVLPGGQVATTVVACQHWGLRTRYVGKLGDDLAAPLHREASPHPAAVRKPACAAPPPPSTANGSSTPAPSTSTATTPKPPSSPPPGPAPP